MEIVKLDVTNKKILAELDKNCRVPNSVLAKKVNKSREAVKYRIQQLQKQGVIERFITSINPNRLGFYMFKAYLKLENNPEEKEKFLRELKNSKDVYWIGISDGTFDCVLAILSKSITEYFTKINKLLSRWKHLIISQVLGMMVDTRQYTKKIFTNDTHTKCVVFGGDVITEDIDKLDASILNVLINNARIPLAELAREVKSTIEIVRRRIERLEAKRIILGYRIAVDFNKLGFEFFKAFIYFKSLSEKDESALFEWMKMHQNSVYYIRSLAPWQAEFEFVVKNYQQFNQIINDLRESFPHVIRNHEHLIISYELWMPAYKELLKE